MASVRIIQERRLSRKIIIGQITRYLPFLRPFINIIRFLTFRKQCPSYPHSQASYSDGSWLDRKVTKDQQAMEDYIFQEDLRGKKILHVGIGSSHIAKKCAEIDECSIDGITVVHTEKSYADDLRIKNYVAHIMNKNDLESLSKLPGNYTYIIDNDIAAYACCKAHFEQMLKQYLSMLAIDGEILAGKVSIGYFDSGFPLPNFYLKKLSEKYACVFMRTNDYIKITSKRLY